MRLLIFLCIFCPDIALADPELGIEINAVRQMFNLPQLAQTAPLACAASMHSEDLASRDACTHTGKDGSTFQTRARRCKTVAVGEIVACGHSNAKKVVRDWMNDRISRAMILDPEAIAMGVARSDDKWVFLIQ